MRSSRLPLCEDAVVYSMEEPVCVLAISVAPVLVPWLLVFDVVLVLPVPDWLLAVEVDPEPLLVEVLLPPVLLLVVVVEVEPDWLQAPL